MAERLDVHNGPYAGFGDGVVFATPEIVARIEEPKVMSISKINAKLHSKGYGGFGTAKQISTIGSYNLVGFSAGGEDCIVFDEVDSVKIDSQKNTINKLCTACVQSN